MTNRNSGSESGFHKILPKAVANATARIHSAMIIIFKKHEARDLGLDWTFLFAIIGHKIPPTYPRFCNNSTGDCTSNFPRSESHLWDLHSLHLKLRNTLLFGDIGSEHSAYKIITLASTTRFPPSTLSSPKTPSKYHTYHIPHHQRYDRVKPI